MYKITQLKNLFCVCVFLYQKTYFSVFPKKCPNLNGDNVTMVDLSLTTSLRSVYKMVDLSLMYLRKQKLSS